MPSKYQSLTNHLASLALERWNPSFDEIEKILGLSLPESAHKYQAWWGNQRQGQSLSWLEAGWIVTSLDLESKQVTFARKSVPLRTPRLPKESTTKNRQHLTYAWDTSPELNCELRLAWAHAGAVQLVDGRLTFPPDIPAAPGLYRMRIRNNIGSESRYVGETDNLRRRLTWYRNPGSTQATNVRMNEIVIKALEGGAEVAISIVTETAWFIQDAERVRADLSKKSVRRLFENFVQVAEGDAAIESLNR